MSSDSRLPWLSLLRKRARGATTAVWLFAHLSHRGGRQLQTPEARGSGKQRRLEHVLKTSEDTIRTRQDKLEMSEQLRPRQPR
jgi:hypothetical protein